MRLIFAFLVLLSFVSCFKTSDELMLEAEKLDENGKYQEAIEKIEIVLDRNPENLGALINLGAYNASLGNREKAIEAYQKVLLIDNDNTLALCNLANNHLNIGNIDLALKFYENALQSKRFIDYNQNTFLNQGEALYDVPFDEIYYQMAMIYIDTKQFEKACSCVSRIENQTLVESEIYNFGQNY